MAFDFENGSYTDAAGRTVLDPAVYKDWQIGAAAEQALPPVDWFRQKLGLLPEELLPYGKTPKLDFLRIMERLKDRPDGKYIEVTAITPTPLGEGKSTTSLGLIEGLGRLGANVGGCLRQPSGGPTMNVKGTAAGGGNALLIPMTEFSLGLTGDINDIMNAHNLAMTALNARMQHERNYDDETLAKRGLRRLDIDPERVQWSFVLDFCCQALRKMRIGLGEGKMDGYPMDTCANIAVSSELMAILSVARDLEDLRRRIGSIVLAYDKQGRPITTEDLEVAGAMTAWMRNTINPTLCYTVEHQPVLVHAGPFANIAIGQSSVIGDRLGLKLFDYHVTESGFAADIGFEQFWRQAALICCTTRPPSANPASPLWCASTSSIPIPTRSWSWCAVSARRTACAAPCPITGAMAVLAPKSWPARSWLPATSPRRCNSSTRTICLCVRGWSASPGRSMAPTGWTGRRWRWKRRHGSSPTPGTPTTAP